MSNMMVLLNGTPGGTDGTELSGDITLKNILNSYGLAGTGDSRPSYGTVGIVVPICIRMKDGYTASSIKITANGTSNMIVGTYTYWSNPDVYLFTSYPTSAPEYPNFTSNSDSYTYSSNPTSIQTNKNYMFLLYITLKKNQTSIPANTPLCQISYQENKVS